MALAYKISDNFPGVKSGLHEIRLAQDETEVDAAQELRYRVFYEEMKAKPSKHSNLIKRDIDRFDEHFEHLLVLDHGRGESISDKVVGTYRLNRKENAEASIGYYTSTEYDISSLINKPYEILELGRSCVDVAYRNGAIMQLLWKGIAAYVFHYDIKLMFGCASLQGTKIDLLSVPLSYLHHNHLAPSNIRPRALSDRFISMDIISKNNLDIIKARKSVPPLIKGYLRLGGYIGEGAVIDNQFNTVDVCIVLQTDKVTSRYRSHYDRDIY
tara:strand:+ start:521 stop:1330 length:810 start_codon:yes stop_codon:yes gene_type:complete